MPRRQPAKEVPRWRRGKSPQAGPQIRLSPRQERQLVQRLAASPALQGQVIQHAAPQSGPAGAIARAGAYRLRHQLVPFAWLAGVTITGLSARTPHTTHAALTGILIGLAAAAVMVLLTRHLPACPEKGKGHQRCFGRHAWRAMAVLTALWVAALSLGAGSWHPLLLLGLACWVCVLIPWVRHYRARADDVPAPAAVKVSDYEIWMRLAAKRRWSGHLGMPEQIPGGVRYPIVLDGSETDIGEVLAQPRKVAAAWGKSITEAYVEPSPDSIESKGSLTLLRRGTLALTREWDGTGIDVESGTAVIGRFADSQPARVRFYARRDGVRHGLIAGATGAGKTYLLDLLVRIALTSGFIIPVILDPQEGQSLPQWRKHLLYAAGTDECMAMLRGLHAGMLDRSRYLSGLAWRDPEDGHESVGLDFFDHEVTGLPMVLIIGDEYPVLLTDKKHGPDAIRLTADLGKRGRKTGVALWPVAQVPSLAELGDQVVRSMLVGGNVVCLRTGDRVSAGMIGLEADPSQLPRYFSPPRPGEVGEPTYGLGYVIGPDNRQAVARIDLVPKAQRRRIPQVPQLDARFAEAMDRAVRMGGVQMPLPAAAPALTAVPSADDDAPAGRAAADAILAVLDEAGTELDRGEIVKRSGVLVTGKWGREKPFSVRAHSDALGALAEAGRIAKVRHGVYAPARPPLRAVPGQRP